jgi:hypothetical protein
VPPPQKSIIAELNPDSNKDESSNSTNYSLNTEFIIKNINTQFVPHRKYIASPLQNQPVNGVYGERNTVYCEDHAKHTDTHCE